MEGLVKKATNKRHELTRKFEGGKGLREPKSAGFWIADPILNFEIGIVRDINDTCVTHITTVFGKHCECIAQKCTHLERLPPLASHLQPVPWKMRLEMIIGMQNEILIAIMKPVF